MCKIRLVVIIACVIAIVSGAADQSAAQAPDSCNGYSPGDANGDGLLSVGDAVYIMNYIFKGGPAPVPYELFNGDANCDCQVTVADAIYIILRVFQWGPPPCDCEEWMNRCR